MSRKNNIPNPDEHKWIDDIEIDDELDFSDIPEIEVDTLSVEGDLLDIVNDPSNYIILRTRKFDRDETREIPDPQEHLHELSKPFAEPLSRPETSHKITRVDTLDVFGFDTLKVPPPTPATILLREVERRAPEVDWQKRGGRGVYGKMESPVAFEVTVDILLMQPLCVHIELRLAHTVYTADGEIHKVWQEISEQLKLVHRDVSLADFFLNRGG